MMHKSEYNQLVFHAESGRWYLYNTYRADYAKLTDEEKTSFDAYPDIPLDAHLSAKLEGCGALTDVNEIASLRQNCAERMKRAETLFLIICPTMDCNFACPYCVETGQRRHGIMDDETAYSLKRFFDRMLDESKVKEVCVHWYGGEPLLALSRMKDLGRHFLTACRVRRVRYISNITTNGYLLDENAIRTLDGIGVYSYRITLDGAAETHDKVRMLAGGKGTYSRIMHNMEKLCETQRQIEIRCNVSKDNADKLAPLEAEIDRLKAINNSIYLHYARMFVYRDVPGVLAETAMTEEEFSRFCMEHKDEKYDLLSVPKSVPCKACLPFSYCIDERGNIYKCNSFLSQENHVIGNVNDLPDGKRLDGSNDAEIIRELAFPEGSECLSCKLLPQCMGSCPISKSGEKRCHPLKNSLEQYVLQIAETDWAHEGLSYVPNETDNP